MLYKNKYLMIAIIISILACATVPVALLLAPARLELVLYWTQFGCVLAAFGCALDCVRRDRENLFFQLQVGAIGCFTLGLIFWVVHLTVLGYDDETISISDLSCVGFYLFLLSAVAGTLNPETRKGDKIHPGRIAAALTAPVFVLITGVLQLIFVAKDNWGNIVFVLFYTAVFTPLSYYTLKLLILPAKRIPRMRVMKPYNLVVLGILTVNIVWNVSSFLMHGRLAYLLSVLMTSILLLLIVPAAYGGYKKWECC